MIAPYRALEIPLERLRPGEPARIARIAGPPEDVHRLEEFGLRPGTPVEVFRAGRPCILRVAGAKVCLRMEHRLQILVAPGQVGAS